MKNGPSLGGYGAVAMNAALTASMTTLPEQLRKTLTWDRGVELVGHAQFALETGTKVFFADPHSPWQRPTNENTNGLLRQYFSKAPTCPDGQRKTSKPSPSRSTTDPARSSTGRPPQRPSKSINSPVLQRLITSPSSGAASSSTRSNVTTWSARWAASEPWATTRR